MDSKSRPILGLAPTHFPSREKSPSYFSQDEKCGGITRPKLRQLAVDKRSSCGFGRTCVELGGIIARTGPPAMPCSQEERALGNVTAPASDAMGGRRAL